MGSGRPRLPLGTYGDIWIGEQPHSTKKRPRYIARAQFRGADGRARKITRTGQSKAAAERALRAALAEQKDAYTAAAIHRGTTISDLADLWLTANRDQWTTNTVERYELAVRNQVKPYLGEVGIAELRRSTVGDALRLMHLEHGPKAAKSAKSCLSGMCKMAMRSDVIDSNPVADSYTIHADAAESVRALTQDEADRLCDLLRADAPAVAWDLPDLVEWMLGTGVRIGEACAALEPDVDMAAKEWMVNATLVRVKGVGMVIQERAKTAAGHRKLPLPRQCIDIIERRTTEARLAAPEVLMMSAAKEVRTAPNPGVIFTAPGGTLRDPSNTSGDLRKVLDRIGCPDCGGRGWHAALKTDLQNRRPPKAQTDKLGQVWNQPCDGTPPFAWLHSHVLRKTVATRLDEAGLSARGVADQLGHARPSMTQDVYMGRKVVSADAARILER